MFNLIILERMKKLKLKHNYMAEYKFIFFLFILTLLPIFLLKISSNKTCVTFEEIGRIRGAKIIIYTFQVNGTSYDGNFEFNRLSKENLKRFLNGTCIEIEYSTLFPSFNQVIQIKES